mmetsp:Transcript_5131/g.7846  ORF Transcript_5131/g.7846 Transcript_5131/m.7846 type:complete len:211 (-) Transcript_5131:1004-1636(-)
MTALAVMGLFLDNVLALYQVVVELAVHLLVASLVFPRREQEGVFVLVIKGLRLPEQGLVEGSRLVWIFVLLDDLSAHSVASTEEHWLNIRKRVIVRSATHIINELKVFVGKVRRSATLSQGHLGEEALSLRDVVGQRLEDLAGPISDQGFLVWFEVFDRNSNFCNALAFIINLERLQVHKILGCIDLFQQLTNRNNTGAQLLLRSLDAGA